MARADRLFSDKHFRNVSMFTELAEKKKLKVIVPGRAVYDFTKTKDLQAFQKEMQDAYNYLATQILYLFETRQQKVQRGLMAAGICLRRMRLTGSLERRTAPADLSPLADYVRRTFSAFL